MSVGLAKKNLVKKTCSHLIHTASVHFQWRACSKQAILNGVSKHILSLRLLLGQISHFLQKNADKKRRQWRDTGETAKKDFLIKPNSDNM